MREIAYVKAYRTESAEENTRLETALIRHFDAQSALMNGKTPTRPAVEMKPSDPTTTVQVTSVAEIAAKKDPTQRLPRQANHYASLVDHFLAVKKSVVIARVMHSHFVRLKNDHRALLGLTIDEPKV